MGTDGTPGTSGTLGTLFDTSWQIDLKRSPIPETPATCQDVVLMTFAHLAKATHAVGNDALGVVISSELFRQGSLAIDRVVLQEDLEETKRVCRQFIKDVVALLRQHVEHAA